MLCDSCTGNEIYHVALESFFVAIARMLASYSAAAVFASAGLSEVLQNRYRKLVTSITSRHAGHRANCDSSSSGNIIDEYRYRRNCWSDRHAASSEGSRNHRFKAAK